MGATMRSPESQICCLTHTHNVRSGQMDDDLLDRLVNASLAPGNVNVTYGCNSSYQDWPWPSFTA
jgi:hypothetical protein